MTHDVRKESGWDGQAQDLGKRGRQDKESSEVGFGNASAAPGLGFTSLVPPGEGLASTSQGLHNSERVQHTGTDERVPVC